MVCTLAAGVDGAYDGEPDETYDGTVPESSDIKLQWTAQLTGASPGAEPEISIFTALREQLGLRLEPTKTNADFVIIDSIDETPTPD